jgi:hypothetical protein
MMPRSTPEKIQAAKAQTYFRRAARDETGSGTRKQERVAGALKMANLRRLRLEKEAADKLTAESAGEPAKPAPEKRAPRKQAAIMRLRY